MKLYCNCLNICIEIFGDIVSDKPINAVFPIDLMDEESCEVEVIQISHRLPHLIKEKINDQWKIYSCLNCRLFVYATRKELNQSVVNRKLLNDPNIVSELSLSENFSPAFKIILKQDDSISEDMFEHRLHEVAANWLREEAQRTEERIRNYTEQQYAALENHRLRAHKDDFIINRIVTQANRSDGIGDSTNDSKDEIGFTPKKNAKNKSINNEEVIHDGSDAIMFPLDDFDHPAKDFSDGPSDEDEEDLSKIVQMRKSSSSAHLARSLPIPVPQYMHDLAYDEKSNGSPPVPTDIAASIRALAKSVHGDSVFGELPRPRFRNHL